MALKATLATACSSLNHSHSSLSYMQLISRYSIGRKRDRCLYSRTKCPLALSVHSYHQWRARRILQTVITQTKHTSYQEGMWRDGRPPDFELAMGLYGGHAFHAFCGWLSVRGHIARRHSVSRTSCGHLTFCQRAELSSAGEWLSLFLWRQWCQPRPGLSLRSATAAADLSRTRCTDGRRRRLNRFAASTTSTRARPLGSSWPPPGRAVICLPVNFKRDYGLHRGRVGGRIPMRVGSTTITRCQLRRMCSVERTTVGRGYVLDRRRTSWMVRCICTGLAGADVQSYGLRTCCCCCFDQRRRRRSVVNPLTDAASDGPYRICWWNLLFIIWGFASGADAGVRCSYH